ncbi:MAG TPA: ADP-forming succinate--CoA ligase subunit beta [Gammaproteobacteria bacterium]|nr:ADP-forming succinate--CoA ligase subunit beta [Gammaproteobacteria bacterium]
MNLHEFQAKQLFQTYGIPVPEGRVASTAAEAAQAARALGGDAWVVKAQIHAGGRGKAGGVRTAATVDEVHGAARALLGSRLATAQTGPSGLPVEVVLVETPVAAAAEYYLGLLVDRARERMVVMASRAGGMDIEAVAAQDPEAVVKAVVNPAAGVQPYQCRRLGFALGLEAAQMKGFTALVQGLCRLFADNDASLVEINPLVATDGGELLALDAKVNLDDNALYRHPDLAARRDPTQEDPKERAAREQGLNYITLDGAIACMVNGAGLAMATMDLVKLHGGEPANFLDVGGGATADRVAEAFKLIVSDHKVRAILVNIFGGIVRCDLIAEGIIQAVREVEVAVPVVVRLEGTNVERGRELLAGSGLNVLPAADLTEAARTAVQAAEASP